MSLSKLSKLPPEVLSCVLNNQALPLARRLRLRLISNRWCDIIEDGLKRETSLVVRDQIATDYSRTRKPDDLVIQFTDPTDAFTRPLSRLFPSLTQLTVNFVTAASWNAVPSLLAHLDSTNLSTVKLYSSCEDYEHFEPMAAALNALSRLTALTLFGYHLSVRILPRLKPVLSRLEKFGCEHWFPNLPSILSSNLSPRCTHLWLRSGTFQSFASPFLVELSTNLTHLHLLFCRNATIWQSISQMHSLSSLTLDFGAWPHLDASLFSHLGPFLQLTQVKLLDLKYRAPLDWPSKKETPLSSIQHLTLGLYFGDSPVDYPAFFSAISVWFPNMGKLTLLAEPGDIPAIQGSLGQLPFSVEIGDRLSIDTFYAEW